MSLKTTIAYIFYLFTSWTLFRFFFSFPEVFDELFFKPLIWLSPVVFLIIHRKRKLIPLGIQKSNFYRNIRVGVFFSFVLFTELILLKLFLGQKILFRGFNLYLLLISIATGFVEEVTFRGFIMNQLRKYVGGLKANVVTSVLFLLIHLPMVVFVTNANYSQIGAFLFLSASLGFVEGIVYLKTNGVVASIFSHSLWNFLNTLI